MIVHPTTQPLQAWQWRGDFAAAPLWVRLTCRQNGEELIHERQSGRQVVNLQEWLVRDLDGAVNFYSPQEYQRVFRS